MNMFDIIRQRNMAETELLRLSRLNDPTYNRIPRVPIVSAPPVEIEPPVAEEVAEEAITEEVPETIVEGAPAKSRKSRKKASE